jgi:hypothetical protein
VTSTAKKILEVALTLPADDRRRLGEAILDSVPTVPPDDVEQAWVEEARRRATEVERGEGELVELEDALRELRASVRRMHGG